MQVPGITVFIILSFQQEEEYGFSGFILANKQTNKQTNKHKVDCLYTVHRTLLILLAGGISNPKENPLGGGCKTPVWYTGAFSI